MTDVQGMSEEQYELMLHLLFTQLQMRTREELRALEEELRRGNRFFPQSDIVTSLDELVPLCVKKMDAGTNLYRARTIDKYHEPEFTKPIRDACIDALKKCLPDAASNMLSRFDYRRMHEVFAYAAAALAIRGDAFDTDALIRGLWPLCEDGWWGYESKEIDAPPEGFASDGRVNPRGIRYLYTSDAPRTSLLEVRPVLGQLAGVAEIELSTEVTLFDISQTGSWKSEAYAQPTHMDPNVLAEYFAQPNFGGVDGYLATQYISEYIKNKTDSSGAKMFDGLCFSSSLDPSGLNVVLFDTSEDGRQYVINQSALCQATDLSGSFDIVLPLNEKDLLALSDEMEEAGEGSHGLGQVLG